MTGLLGALQGLLHRAGISLNILVVAVVAVAAVSIGPAYYAAAQSSVVQDTVGNAPAAGRGLEVAQSGPVNAVTQLAGQVHELLGQYLGSQRDPGPAVRAAGDGRGDHGAGRRPRPCPWSTGPASAPICASPPAAVPAQRARWR